MDIDELRSATHELGERAKEICVDLAHFQAGREEIERVIEPLRRSGYWRTASDTSKEGNQHFAALRHEVVTLRKMVAGAVQELVSLTDKVMDLLHNIHIGAHPHWKLRSSEPLERANNAIRAVTDEILDIGGDFEIAPPAEMVYRLLAAGMILSAALGDSIPEETDGDGDGGGEEIQEEEVQETKRSKATLKAVKAA
jgi:hypothetical protein